MSDGPLAGVRLIELAAIGPAPFAAMMLGDMGADVIRIDRIHPVPAETAAADIVLRNRRSIAVDTKTDAGRQIVLDLAEGADAFIEGFRPGTTERLGFGPAECLARNPRLVYGRMTGWGQDGPLAQTAGHDIDYIAITGALWGSRRAGQRPVPPMNLLGDLGGGATYLAFGIVCALMHARATGLGQVVDANIVDGTASLTNFIRGLRAQGMWTDQPGANLLDTGAPFYDTYVCADGKEIAIGALEAKFYAELLHRSGAADAVLAGSVRDDPAGWPEARQRWAALFATRTRDEWTELLQYSDACAAPVLSWDEAPEHAHLAARQTFVEIDGVLQGAPAPRFSLTPGAISRPPPRSGEHGDDILRALGRPADEIADLRSNGVLG